MEHFIFHDIFSTKDIDYLLAIVSLLMLIPFWKTLRGRKYEAMRAGSTEARPRRHTEGHK